MQRFGQVRFPLKEAQAREEPESEEDCGCASSYQNSSHAQCDCTGWGAGGAILGFILGGIIFTAAGRGLAKSAIGAGSRVTTRGVTALSRKLGEVGTQ